MIIGVDIGTQSLKAIVLSDQLEILGQSSIAYQPAFPRPGWAEQDPMLWESALNPAIAGALQAASVSARDIKAIGFAGQLDGCIPIDSQGLPLHPCLIWMDRRADAEIEDCDAQLIQRIGGGILDPQHAAAKIRWLKRHVHAVASARHFHCAVSYIVSRLTDEHVVDYATASTSMVYGLASQKYDASLLAMFGLDEAELPSPRPAESVAGALNDTGSLLTGLPPGLPVAVGTGDDFASVLGAGLVAPGRLINILGTAEVVGALHKELVIDYGLMLETHAFSGDQFFVENPGWLSGGALTWFQNTFGLPSVQTLDAEASVAGAGAGGVLFLPALTGAMTPQWIASARGAFYGLTPSHDRGHFARAMLEGSAFAMRDVLERVQSLGVPVDALRAVGGGARSALWCQIRADLTGMTVEIPRHADTSPIGAALLAGVAAGVLPGLVEAASHLGRDLRIVEPRASLKVVYDHAYHRYRELFSSLKQMFTSES